MVALLWSLSKTLGGIDRVRSQKPWRGLVFPWSLSKNPGGGLVLTVLARKNPGEGLVLVVFALKNQGRVLTCSLSKTLGGTCVDVFALKNPWWDVC